MNIIVAGCGKIGKTIVSSLVSEGHNVTVIDKDKKVIEEITDTLDAMGVCGDAEGFETLEEAGVANADLFVAATNFDEINMLGCLLAKRMGAAHTIPRIRNPRYNADEIAFLRQQLDFSIAINPEFEAAKEAFNIIKFPSAVKVETFSRRNFEMIEFKLSNESVLDGMSLKDVRDKYEAKFLVCAVQRENEVTIPDGNFILRNGDKIGITGAPGEIQKFFKELGLLKKQAKNVVILGASRTAYYLTKMLLSNGNGVKIVDTDPEKCLDFATAFPGATVINGDGARQEVLLEEGLDSADAFAALTGIDEENILMSYFALSRNVPAVMTKVNRNELMGLSSKMGIDRIVSPRKTASDILVRYARALSNSVGSNVETLYKFFDDKAEALEFAVNSDFEYTGTPLSELSIKKNTLIAGILRGRKTVIPMGSDVILPDDRVIVVTSGEHIDSLDDIIR